MGARRQARTVRPALGAAGRTHRLGGTARGGVAARIAPQHAVSADAPDAPAPAPARARAAAADRRQRRGTGTGTGRAARGAARCAMNEDGAKRHSTTQWWLNTAIAPMAFGNPTQGSRVTRPTFPPSATVEIDLTDPDQRAFGDYELID